MKRPLSLLEKLFVLVPLCALAWMWRVSTAKHANPTYPNGVLPHAQEFGGAVFSDDGRFLASITSTRSRTLSSPFSNSYSETLHLWNTKTGAQILEVPSSQRFVTFEFSPDGRHLVTTENNGNFGFGINTATVSSRIKIYDTQQGSVLQNDVVQGVISATFVGDGSKLIYQGAPNRLVDATTRSTLLALPADENDFSPVLSRDRNLLVCFRDGLSGAHDAQIWNLKTEQLVTTFPPVPWRGSSSQDRAYFSHDSKIVAVFHDGTVEMRDAQKGSLIKEYPKPVYAFRTRWNSAGKATLKRVMPYYVVRFGLSPTSQHYFMVTKQTNPKDKIFTHLRLAFYNLSTHRQIWQMQWRKDYKSEVPDNSSALNDYVIKFTPNGRALVTLQGENTIVWIDSATGRIFKREPGSDFVFSPNGAVWAKQIDDKLHLMRSGVPKQSP